MFRVVVGIVVALMLMSAAPATLRAQDVNDAGNANADDAKAALTPAQYQSLLRHLRNLQARDANRVRDAEAGLLALGKQVDIESHLQRLATSNRMEVAWRARRILNQLNKDILGDEWFERQFEEYRRRMEELDPAMGDPDGTVTPVDPGTDPVQPPPGEDLTLLALLLAPARVELHSNPQVGQYVTYCMEEFDPAVPAEERITETWAVVAVTDTIVWVEHRTNLLEQVVMQYAVQRSDGAVTRAYGGRAGAAELLPIRIGQNQQLRIPAAKGWQVEEATGFESPAGKFPRARTWKHTITLVEAGEELQLEVADTADESIPFSGLLRRRDVEGDYVTLDLVATGSDHRRTVRPGATVLVTFDDKTYEIPRGEYLAHKDDYDAGTRQPPAGYPEIPGGNGDEPD